jgi:threonine-phosphate decarboxylase
MTTDNRTQPPLHGGQLRQIAMRYGISQDQLIDFSANINPAGPPRSVLAAIQRCLEDPAALAVYPDLELWELRRAVGRYTETEPENIAIANGFVPLLDAAVRSLGIQRCLLPIPSFSEYRNALDNAGVAVFPYCLRMRDGFRYDPESLRDAIVRHRCDAILLANPQNPSGVACDSDTMRLIAQVAHEHKVTLFLDEAFIDYCPAESLAPMSVICDQDIIVFRSVTKFFAIPGLRVAYAVCKPPVIQKMNRYIAPWPVTALAVEATCAALQDRSYIKKGRSINEQRRNWLAQELGQLNITTYPSKANFLLLRLPTDVAVSLLWEKMILEEHIVLRYCANFENLAPEHLRTAVRSEQDNGALVTGLKRALSHLPKQAVSKSA